MTRGGNNSLLSFRIIYYLLLLLVLLIYILVFLFKKVNGSSTISEGSARSVPFLRTTEAWTRSSYSG